MENITVGQIAAAIALIVALIAGFKKINDTVKESLTKVFKELMQPFSKQLNDIDEKLTSIDKATCKNFLVRCLADFEKDNFMSYVEIERFWEQYDHYIDDLKDNSYIKQWTERLVREGKIRPKKG